MENYISKMSFQTLVLLLWYTQVSIGLEGPNVCDGNNGQKQCCYNYEEKDGKCQICKNGTSAKIGQKCLPCSENMYGYKCLKQCSCSTFQRCDKENGCVDILSTEPFSTERYLVYYTRDKFTLRKTEAQDQYTSTYHTMRDESMTKTSEMDDQFERVLHHEMFIYSVCVTVIIVVIGISIIFYKCKKKRLKKVVITRSASMQHVNISTNQEYIYDEIDESGIIDIETEDKNREGRSNMTDYFDFEDADHSISSTESNDDYLYPCHSSNDNSQTDDGGSNAESAEICVDASGYLSSYQQLQDNWREFSYKYESSVTCDVLRRNASFVKKEKDANINDHSCSLSVDAPNKACLIPIKKGLNNGKVQSTNSMSDSETKYISSLKPELCYRISEHVPKSDTHTEINDGEDYTSNDYLDAKSC